MPERLLQELQRLAGGSPWIILKKSVGLEITALL
jgi:hypothetical protein